MSVVSKVNSGLKDRLSHVEYNDILGITTFFDSRLKTFAFYNPACAECIKEIVRSSASLIYNSQLEHQIQDDIIIEDNISKEFSMWNSFDSNISRRRTAASHAINEVHCYLEDDVIPRNKDPLNWWHTNKLKYPKLYKIA